MVGKYYGPSGRKLTLMMSQENYALIKDAAHAATLRTATYARALVELRLDEVKAPMDCVGYRPVEATPATPGYATATYTGRPIGIYLEADRAAQLEKLARRFRIKPARMGRVLLMTAFEDPCLREMAAKIEVKWQQRFGVPRPWEALGLTETTYNRRRRKGLDLAAPVRAKAAHRIGDAEARQAVVELALDPAVSALDAARRLRMSLTTIRRACRLAGVRWVRRSGPACASKPGADGASGHGAGI
jgi:hypothetical protein